MEIQAEKWEGFTELYFINQLARKENFFFPQNTFVVVQNEQFHNIKEQMEI